MIHARRCEIGIVGWFASSCSSLIGHTEPYSHSHDICPTSKPVARQTAHWRTLRGQERQILESEQLGKVLASTSVLLVSGIPVIKQWFDSEFSSSLQNCPSPCPPVALKCTRSDLLVYAFRDSYYYQVTILHPQFSFPLQMYFTTCISNTSMHQFYPHTARVQLGGILRAEENKFRGARSVVLDIPHPRLPALFLRVRFDVLHALLLPSYMQSR